MADQLVNTRTFRWGGLLLILAFTIIYAFTLDTGLQPHELHGGDLITHQYAQVQARPSNAPGYPLYTMGGWLWFHTGRALLQWFGQPLPNPMPILSSYSTLWALLALWFFYLILGKLVGTSRHPGLATLFCWLVAAFLGVTYFFWYYATTTEQYSSAVAQTLAILYLYLQWEEQPEQRLRLYLLALLCGISLAHMLTVAFIVPPLVAAVLWRSPTLLRNVRAIFFSVVAALIPLTSYIYVYLRGALNPNWWGRGYWETPNAWFWSFVSTSQGRDELAWAFEPGRSFLGNGFPETMWHELSLPLFLLGLVGIAFLPRRHALLLYGTLLIYAIFCWLYRFGNWFQVIIPAYPLILIGLVPLYRTVDRQAGTTGRLVVTAALTVSLAWRVDASLPAANSRNRASDTALDRAAVLLDQPLPHDARLFAAVDDALAISYLTEIWGIRPDMKPINSRDADDDIREGATIYATVDATPALLNELSQTPLRYSFSPDWIALVIPNYVATEAATAAAAPVHHTITPAVSLINVQSRPAPTGAPLQPPTAPALDVLLTWQLEHGIWPAELAISLRPTYQGAPMFDPTSGEPLQQDRPRPVHGLWLDIPKLNAPELAMSNLAGEPVLVQDAYRLPQPAAIPHRADGLLLIVYTQTATGFVNVAEIALPLPRE